MRALLNEVIQEDLERITTSVKSDLQRIVNSHVVLTGASGFIGQWLTLSFLQARKELGGNGQITLNCRNSAPLQELLEEAKFVQGFDFLECDVRKFPQDVIQDGTLLIHAATPARASLNNDNPLEMFDIIVEGQKRLLHLAAQKESVRFLFLSSGAVYGAQPMDLLAIPETWTGGPDVSNPANAYHEGKRAAELIGNLYSKNSKLEFVSARLFAFLAPLLPLDEHFAAGNFLKDALNDETITITSGGGSIRSYLYSTDLCCCLWGLAIKGKSQEAYNIGSPTEVTLRELARIIQDTINPESEVKVLGSDTEDNVTRYVPDIEKISSLLGFSQSYSLEEIIERTARWVRLSEK